MTFETPILFIVFNRPEVTQLVFNQIKRIKPAKLFISADGARKSVPHERLYCEEVKKIVSDINWPCEIYHKYNENNLGCGLAVSSAITWFFEHVEQGIILEDDCLPDISFFNYCTDLLDYYKNDSKVMHIGGVNFQDKKRGDGDYYFSAVAHVWGWATWRRAWQLYTFNIEGFDKFKHDKIIDDYYNDPSLKLFVIENLELMKDHKIDTWDHQWTYTIYKHGGVSIIPNVNLISNIGFISNATHTFDDKNKQANNPLHCISLPIHHPEKIIIDKNADNYFYFNIVQVPKTGGINGVINKIVFFIKNKILNTIDFLLANLYFKVNNGNTNNILIVKPDAIGDYVIFRNLMASIILNRKSEKYNFYLLANIRLKSFIEETDKSLFKDIIYYEEGISAKYKTYINFCFKIKKLKAEKVIYSVFSRRAIFDDFIDRSGAKYKISPQSDTANQPYELLVKTNKIYSSLVPLKADGLHEFDKMKYFLEICFNEKIEISKPTLPAISSLNIKSNRIIICPGSNEPYKIWSAENFAKLANKIKQKYTEYMIDIVCGPGEEYLGKIIKENSPEINRIINVNNIITLCTEIENCVLVISNDSAPIHIAVAFSVKNICLFNGSRYARFVPYPLSITETNSVVVPAKFSQALNSSTKHYYYHNLTKMDINEISVDSAFKQVNNMIDAN